MSAPLVPPDVVTPPHKLPQLKILLKKAKMPFPLGWTAKWSANGERGVWTFQTAGRKPVVGMPALMRVLEETGEASSETPPYTVGTTKPWRTRPLKFVPHPYEDKFAEFQNLRNLSVACWSAAASDDLEAIEHAQTVEAEALAAERAFDNILAANARLATVCAGMVDTMRAVEARVAQCERVHDQAGTHDECLLARLELVAARAAAVHAWDALARTAAREI